MKAESLVLLTALAATLFMTGLIWFVQIVHYFLFDQIGTTPFATYERMHTHRTTLVVMPVMLLELVATGALLQIRPAYLPSWMAWAALLLLGLIWASTFFIQVPLHGRLSAGFDPEAYGQLVSSNWLRTWAWTVKSALLLYGVYKGL